MDQVMTASNRRGFLRAATLFAGASVCGGVGAAAGLVAPDLPRLGIQLYSLRGFTRNEALRHASEMGFAQVEFYSGMLALDASDDEIDETKRRLRDLGLSVSGHGVNRFTSNAAENRRIFEFAARLGAPCITADPDLDSFDSLNELVKEFNIRVAIHNHGPGHRYNKAIDVLRVIEGRDERIGACADLGHYIRSGQLAPEVIRLLRGRLYGVHLKDFAEMKDKTKGVILGKGHLNVEEVFTELKAAGFPVDGALSLEYEENEKDPLADIRACVSVAKAAMDAVGGR